MAELEHVVKTFSLLETAEKEQPFLTREQKQDLYRIAFHKESMEEVEKIILQLQAPHAGKEEKERILYHYLEPFFQVPENILQIENYIFQLQYMTYEKEKANHMLEALLKQENIQYDLEAMLTEGKIKAAVPVKRTGQWDRRERMSEIQDAAQIIKVSFEGAEIILKMGNTGWQFVKDICAVFKKVLDQEKLSGKTSVQKLLKMGGDLQVFRFETKDLERVKALANKYGILYSILPDLNEKDGMSEILFHSQAAPRIQSMMAKIEHSNIGTLDEYYENAEPDKVEQLVEEVKKPALPEPKECELVARELAKNQVEKISNVRSRLNMTWLQIWPIICYMEEQGILEKGRKVR